MPRVHRSGDAKRSPLLAFLVVRFVTLGRCLAFLFGREGTILISSISFSFFCSVFPIIVLLLSLASYLGLTDLRSTIFSALSAFFPVAQDFIVRNLRIYTREIGRLQLVSFLLIIWAGSAFFFAMEAGLDAAYRVRKPRRFASSQFVGTATAVLAGLFSFLALFFMALLRAATRDLNIAGLAISSLTDWIISFVLTAVLIATIYAVLPHRKDQRASVIPETLFASVLWILIAWLFRRLGVSVSMKTIYGPFFVSMTILLWAYATGCVLLAGARLASDGFFSRGGSQFRRPIGSTAATDDESATGRSILGAKEVNADSESRTAPPDS